MAELDADERDKFKSGQFAYVDADGNGHLPIQDAAHVRNAMARFNQTQMPDSSKPAAKRKILAAAKKFGIEVGDFADVKEAAVVPMASSIVIDLREAAGDDGAVPVLLVAAGESKGVNGPVDYRREVLAREAAKFDGVKVFDNHQSDKEEREKPYRSVKEHWATIRETAYDPTPRPDAPNGGIVGKMQVHDPWFAERVRTAPETVKLSIRATGTGKREKRDGRDVAVLESFRSVRSCDAVTDAGAGGQILSLREAAAREEASMLTDQLTAADVRANPALWDAVKSLALQESKVVPDYNDQYQGDDVKSWERRMATAKRDNDQDKHDALLDKMPQGAEHDRDQCHLCRGDVPMKEASMPATPTDTAAVALKETQDRIAALERQLAERETAGRRQDALAGKVRQSGLPAVAQEQLLAELKEASLPADEAEWGTAVDGRISRMREFVQKFAQAPRVVGMGGEAGAPVTIKEAVQRRIEARMGVTGLPQKRPAQDAAATAADRLAAKI